MRIATVDNTKISEIRDSSLKHSSRYVLDKITTL